MLNFDKLAFDYEPYPIGLAQGAIEPETYAEMVKSFPSPEVFKAKPAKGVKMALSHHNHGRAYHAFVRQTPVWQRFYDYIKSPDFIAQTLAALKARNLDLGLQRRPLAERAVESFKALKKGAPLPHYPRLSSRFEFSAMPIAGGSIRPHTDNPTKVITMVVSMLEPDEWDPAVGGGTAVVRPKDPTRIFNYMNGYLDFEEVEVVKTFPFNPNQCLVFVKTYNSWHAVWPMTGNDPARLRKTLTINIESS